MSSRELDLAGTEDGAGVLPPEIIDMDTFGQLLEMDDEDDREFSKEIVWNFFEQANTTFQEMDEAVKEKDLSKLSTLGHFLKGSSAAVGVIRVRDGCEAMQHLGKLHDESGVLDITEKEALQKVEKTLQDVKTSYTKAEGALKKFYDEGEDAAEADTAADEADEATPPAVADDASKKTAEKKP
ncbi:unnamed protein product [Parajaminaea phylloscopi]